MELRHLRYFVAVAEELNFSRAARRLHTAQPSLSQQIRQLETHLGTPLLERSTRRVRLTNAGRLFLRESRDILHRIELAIEQASAAATGKTGELAVGVDAPAQINIVPKIFPRVAHRLPKLKLMVHSLSMAEQIVGLRDYSIDVGFLRGPVNEADLTSEVIFREKIALVLPPHHRLARLKRVPIQMLDNLPCVTITRRGFQAIRDVVASMYEQAGIRVRSVQEADSTLTHLEMVGAGLGYALLPEFVESILPRGVVMRPLDFAHVPSICMVAAYRRGEELLAVRNLMEVVRHCFRNSPK